MQNVDEATLEKIVKEVSNQAAIGFIKFRWKKMNFQNVMRYLEFLSTYANIGKIVVAPLPTPNSSSNLEYLESSAFTMEDFVNPRAKEYEIAVSHHLGLRWSKFLGIYFSNLFTTAAAGIKASYEFSNKNCFVHVSLPI